MRIFGKQKFIKQSANILLCPNCGSRLTYLMPSGHTLGCNQCNKYYVNDSGKVGPECNTPYTRKDVHY